MAFTKDVQVTIPAEAREAVAAALEAWHYCVPENQREALVEIRETVTIDDNRLCRDGGQEHPCSFDDDGIGTCVDCGARIDPAGELIA